MLVIGNCDMEAKAISVRVYGKGNLGSRGRAPFIVDLLAAINRRDS